MLSWRLGVNACYIIMRLNNSVQSSSDGTFGENCSHQAHLARTVELLLSRMALR